MDKLQDFIYQFFEENKENLTKIVVENVLREICFLCYEELQKTAYENKSINAESLFLRIKELMKKDAT